MDLRCCSYCFSCEVMVIMENVLYICLLDCKKKNCLHDMNFMITKALELYREYGHLQHGPSPRSQQRFI